MNTSTHNSYQHTRELTLSEIERISGAGPMELATGWAGTAMGALSGGLTGGLRGLAIGGVGGFALGLAMGTAYSLATGSGSGRKPVVDSTKAE
ncbi:hypothetical protein GCM10007052_33410 [Halioglobus japonicus]|uniref:hypothetical protein n=1 Tax=Halioglobus sp. HI00S01 TaxID=1822214 RepID=UPI0012E8D02B|nr:hypothetical protein [Halioglobus sp. HI00S01]GHD22078.1 hypothetical protein GCM10007052_33410 [Halioglobus japonicus]